MRKVSGLECPACSAFIRIAKDEDPSSEQRMETENINGGLPATDYYFYKNDADRDLVEKDYLEKGKKNFPGNKNTPVDFETPEDMPRIAPNEKLLFHAKKEEKEMFVSSICKGCGHHVVGFKMVSSGIHWDEKIEDYELVSFGRVTPEEWDQSYEVDGIEELSNEGLMYASARPKNKESGSEIIIISAKEDFDSNEQAVVAFIANGIPSFIRSAIDEFVTKEKIAANGSLGELYDEFWGNFQNQKYPSIMSERILDPHEDEIKDYILDTHREEIDEIDLANLTKAIEKEWGYEEKESDYHEWSFNYGDYEDKDRAVNDFVASNGNVGQVYKEGARTLEFELDGSFRSGNEWKWNELKEFTPFDGDEISEETARSLRESFKEIFYKVVLDAAGGFYGDELARLVVKKIGNILNEPDEEKEGFYYTDQAGDNKPMFPSTGVKKGVLFLMGDYGMELDEFTYEEMESIPTKEDIVGQIPAEATLKYTKTAIDKRAYDVDLNQSHDLLSHENQPVDKNNPSNSDPLMGDDLNRVVSNVEEEKQKKDFKKMDGINYKAGELV